jgi:hypothetical protein
MQIATRWLRLALEVFGGVLLVLLTLLVSFAATVRLMGSACPGTTRWRRSC